VGHGHGMVRGVGGVGLRGCGVKVSEGLDSEGVQCREVEVCLWATAGQGQPLRRVT